MGVFAVIHVFFIKKKCITERVFILVNKGAVNITNFIHEDLPFIKKHWRRKWFVHSIFFPHIQISSRQSLKL